MGVGLGWGGVGWVGRGSSGKAEVAEVSDTLMLLEWLI